MAGTCYTFPCTGWKLAIQWMQNTNHNTQPLSSLHLVYHEHSHRRLVGAILGAPSISPPPTGLSPPPPASAGAPQVRPHHHHWLLRVQAQNQRGAWRYEDEHFSVWGMKPFNGGRCRGKEGQRSKESSLLLDTWCLTCGQSIHTPLETQEEQWKGLSSNARSKTSRDPVPLAHHPWTRKQSQATFLCSHARSKARTTGPTCPAQNTCSLSSLQPPRTGSGEEHRGKEKQDQRQQYKSTLVSGRRGQGES